MDHTAGSCDGARCTIRTSTDEVGCLSSVREVATTSILFTATHGSDDPTKATIPFIGAVGALEAGHEPSIALLGEGAYLAVESVANAIHGIGFPPLSTFFTRIFEHGVPVYV